MQYNQNGKMTFKYVCIYLPSGEIFNQSIEVGSERDFLLLLNSWNRISNLSGKPSWFYYSDDV